MIEQVQKRCEHTLNEAHECIPRGDENLPDEAEVLLRERCAKEILDGDTEKRKYQNNNDGPEDDFEHIQRIFLYYHLPLVTRDRTRG